MNSKKIEDITIVEIPDSVDSGNADAVEKELVELIKTGALKLVCDMRGSTYVSSAGLRVFMEACNVLEENSGKIALFGLSEIVYEVFNVTGLNEVFPIVDNEAAAMAAVS